ADMIPVGIFMLPDIIGEGVVVGHKHHVVGRELPCIVAPRDPCIADRSLLARLDCPVVSGILGVHKIEWGDVIIRDVLKARNSHSLLLIALSSGRRRCFTVVTCPDTICAIRPTRYPPATSVSVRNCTAKAQGRCEWAAHKRSPVWAAADDFPCARGEEYA